MGRPTQHARERLAALKTELATLRASAPYQLASALELLRDVVGADAVGYLTFEPDRDSVLISRVAATLDVGGEIGERYRAAFNGHSPRERIQAFSWCPMQPAEDDRNRVHTGANGTSRKGRGPAKSLGNKLLAPFGVRPGSIARVLLCDDKRPVAYVAAMSAAGVEKRHTAALTSVVPFLRDRFRMEERLESARWARDALDAVLENTGAPAFVVNDRGSVLHANSVGQSELDRNPDDTRASLVESLAGARHHHIVRLESPTAPLFLAITKKPVDVDARVASWSARLGLSPQSAAALRLLARGELDKRIAGELGISVRTAEGHCSRLLERVGVSNRAALVAKVLGG